MAKVSCSLYGLYQREMTIAEGTNMPSQKTHGHCRESTILETVSLMMKLDRQFLRAIL